DRERGQGARAGQGRSGAHRAPDREGKGRRARVIKSLRWRIVAILATLLLFAWYTAANFVPAAVRKESRWLPSQAIRLGLDLQGGIHWVLGPDLDVAIEHELDVLRGSLHEGLAEKNVTPTKLSVDGTRLVVEAANPEDLAKIRSVAGDTKVLREAKSD